jgi:hypothetical protein
LPNRRCTHLALVGHFLIIAKLEEHDIRAPILGMCRVVARSRSIPILSKTTWNLHDLARTILLAPLLNQVNCVRTRPYSPTVLVYAAPDAMPGLQGHWSSVHEQ